MKSVLFANPFGLGDVIFTLRVAQALKTARPATRIGFLGNERTEELLRATDCIEWVHRLDREGFRTMGWARLPGAAHRLFAEVRERRYEALVDVSLGRELSLYAALAGIRTRVGFDYRRRGIFLTHKHPLSSYEGVPVSQRQAALLTSLGIESPRAEGRIALNLSSEARDRSLELIAPVLGAPETRPLAVAPGGGRSWGSNAGYKQWDADRFAEAADTYASRHDCGLILIGDASERPLLERVLARCRVRGVVMAGRPLTQVACALGRSRALLCNDGGPMHLAGALGVPVVALFGPVDVTAYGPYGERAGIALTADVPCRPCYRGFRFTGCAHQRACLERIPVSDALAALEKIA